MELLLVVVAIAAAVLGIGAFIFAFLVIRLITKGPIIGSEVAENTKSEVNDQDQYVPEYADGTVPLDQFVPDTTKPVSVKYTHQTDEEGNDVIEEKVEDA